MERLAARRGLGCRHGDAGQHPKVYAIGQALKGGNSAVKSFNRQYVAAQLSMLAADLIGERRREVLHPQLPSRLI